MIKNTAICTSSHPLKQNCILQNDQKQQKKRLDNIVKGNHIIKHDYWPHPYSSGISTVTTNTVNVK